MPNNLLLLRFHFSLFLLPVSLFALYFVDPLPHFKTALVIIIWHMLVYPASNGYNSYHDKDQGPIGGLQHPPQPTSGLLLLVNILDILAILLSFLVDEWFPLFVGGYILFSRLYSNRLIRLKQYPVLSFLVVIIFQGAWVFCGNIIALDGIALIQDDTVISAAIASSMLIGTMFPLTQIYQHAADKNDGVLSLSRLLGVRGTFIFSALSFVMVIYLMYRIFDNSADYHYFWIFNAMMFPAIAFFIYWALRSYYHPHQATFKNTMIMLVVSSLFNNLYFLYILY